MRSPTGRVTWGFPEPEPVLQERLQHVHTTAETSKILIACSESVCMWMADLPSARKQRNKRGDTADTLNTLSLNNTVVVWQQMGSKLLYISFWET